MGLSRPGGAVYLPPMVVLAVLLLAPATFACGYYLTLTAVGWRRRTPPAAGWTPRVTVVIPAHDEEPGLAAAVRGVLASDYPADRLRVLVVADNCTDGTAAVARRLGVAVLERHDPARRGKGFALAAGLPAALAGGADAVLVLDADCVPRPDAVRHLAASLNEWDAVQAAVVPRNPEALPAGLVAAVGSELENAVAAGRSGLGLAVALRGTGMMFRADLLRRLPWTGFGLTEDAEYTATLRAAGVRVRFVPAAVVRTEVPPTGAALCTQRRRWRAALAGGGAGRADRLLASKPLVLAHLLLTVAAVAALAPVLPLWVEAWAGGLLLLTGATYLRAMARCDGRVSPAAFLRAGGLAAKLGAVTLAGLARRPAAWERTPRAAEVGA